MVTRLLAVRNLRDLHGYYGLSFDLLDRENRAKGWLHLSGYAAEILLQPSWISNANYLEASVFIQPE